MLYIFALLLAFFTNAAEVRYKKGYYDAVRPINDKRVYTGDYLEANTIKSKRSVIVKTQQSGTGKSTSVQQQRPMQGNSGVQVLESPVVVREKSHYSPYRSFGKKYKTEPTFGAIAKIGIGGQYFKTDVAKYTLLGVTDTVPGHTHTYAVVPIGLEFVYNFDSKNAISINGDFYLNPFQNTIENDVSSKIFEAKTRYMIYLKYAYRINKWFGVYALGGVQKFDFDIYNDLNGQLLMIGDATSPTAGIGFLFYVTPNSSIFLDAVYSKVGKLGDLKIPDARQQAIANKSYNGFQVRVGYAYNFGRAFATRK